MKRRVLIVATSMDEIGGQSIQAARLLDALKNDDAIEADFLPNNPRLSENFRWLQKIKFSRTIFTSLKFWRLLFKNVKKNDVIHIFSPAMTGYIFSALPPLVVSKIYGKKTILNYHSGELAEHVNRWKRTALPTMRKFDEIVVPSQFLVEVFAQFGLQAKEIFNFIDTTKFVFRERNPLRPVFLSNRNFEAHYNVGCVLKAFQNIQKQIPEAELIVAGYGSEEAQLKNLASELELENVQFIGRVEQAAMPKIYNRADIFLNASVIDNMPLSFIEAFSCGLPIVSSDAGGIPYIVENGETGLLVEKNDCEALAMRAVELLEDNSLAQKIIRQAYDESKKYAVEEISKQWREFFKGEN